MRKLSEQDIMIYGVKGLTKIKIKTDTVMFKMVSSINILQQFDNGLCCTFTRSKTILCRWEDRKG